MLSSEVNGFNIHPLIFVIPNTLTGSTHAD